MHSKHITDAEREHLGKVKSTACAVCDVPPPVEAHHIRQGDHWTCIGICVECHRGPVMGWHGQKAAWRVKKMDELDALNVTLKRVAAL